ncbi:hypothetical protein LOTGIDRAFT_182587 [Lottia gigantea]|uniref:D-2-hydroxyglutarate dehydrogenase, mitochondrial n=1 Tax=Lottia gigantea TaxID=225164 RepID=V4BQX2_LOTGI|nr:hypothetical protein LOTGIDRAFT_182587 [Lottia gigantea]ESO91314.1 hypothetical protein LOTGIDRAFT_182587 [Lottia gigantea]
MLRLLRTSATSGTFLKCLKSTRSETINFLAHDRLCLVVTRNGFASGTQIEETAKRYPNLKRRTFEKLSEKDVAFFENLLPGRVVTEKSDLEGANTDWLRTCRGSSSILLRPKSTSEVSSILKYCNERKLAVVPQGGNTGLVGGSVPVFDEIILSTQLMNEINQLDHLSGTLQCQAGCILANLEEYVSDYNLTMPLDLGAKGSCHIGGNLSTNAGGVRLLRYGSLHGSVLGVEAVLADGEVIDCMSALRKDNTGYDVKQLFIGSEGTLGVITAVSILCPQKPKFSYVAFLGCKDFQAVLQIYQQAKIHLGEILSAFEFMDSASMDCVKQNLNLKSPVSESPFYVLIETGGSNGSHDEEKLNQFLEKEMNSGTIQDGTVATDSVKINNVWGLRERMAEGLIIDGYNYKYDISLPLTRFYNLVEDMRKQVDGSATRVVGYGHVGDGNLHLNVTSPEYDDKLMKLIEPFIYDWVREEKGSISAEHGLGFKKRNFIYHSKSRSSVDLMKRMKSMMDPNGILNPYKVLPDND